VRTDHPFQVHVGYNRSPSRGTVTPTAPLPPAAATAPVPPPPPPRPRVRFNYMSEEEDWRGFRAAVCISPRSRANPNPHPHPHPNLNPDQVRISREIVHQPAFDGLRGAEIQPGESIASDAQLDAYLADHLESAYHPCGTCR
jgi:choline dehydrogenase